MDLDSFVNDLLTAAAEADCFQRISLHAEGPIASGRGYVSDILFVRFYFNERTATTAFALIRDDDRIWGIDYDSRRGWHEHPLHETTAHISIEPKSVPEIIAELADVLQEIGQ